MKLLIAITTCHALRARADAQRATWIPSVPAGVDVRFVLGRNGHAPAAARPDELWLDVDDGYFGLPEKSRALYQWACEQGYDFVMKADDDTYIRPERLLAGGFEQHDYTGRLRGPSGPFPAPYASGFARWTSARANRILADASIHGHKAEDRWVGNVLHASGIPCHLDSRFVVVCSRKNAVSFPEGPLRGNQVIAACEYDPTQMLKVHHMWESGQPSSYAPTPVESDGPFSRVAILLKTFLRDGFLLESVASITRCLPGAKMVIVDDGYERGPKITLYAELRRRGHACVWLPLDSGFGAKSNAGLPHCDREFTLIGSDDFDFAGEEVREGILRMMAVLDADPSVATVAGRVDGRAYEGFIERGSDYFREIRLDPERDTQYVTPCGVPYYLVDLTVNYNLVRSNVLHSGAIRWDEKHKIGGDHFDFYEQIRAAGYRIAWCPGVNINQQREDRRRMNHPNYARYRGRAKLAIPTFLHKHGIKRYIGFDGRVDR